ncbi:MAG: hypothetical protein HC905_25070 [Bacteroidales bacterium]|nr:hypothetical protein [Bacteroidales bacterium]
MNSIVLEWPSYGTPSLRKVDIINPILTVDSFKVGECTGDGKYDFVTFTNNICKVFSPNSSYASTFYEAYSDSINNRFKLQNVIIDDINGDLHNDLILKLCEEIISIIPHGFPIVYDTIIDYSYFFVFKLATESGFIEIPDSIVTDISHRILCDDFTGDGINDILIAEYDHGWYMYSYDSVNHDMVQIDSGEGTPWLSETPYWNPNNLEGHSVNIMVT